MNTMISENADMIKCNHNLLESYCHAALIIDKKIKIATKSADKELRELLVQYGTFYEIAKAKYGLLIDEIFRDKLHVKIREKLLSLPTTFRTITINDLDFPKHLKTIPYSTPVLYTIGDISLFNTKTIGVVGSRQIDKKDDIDAGDRCVSRLLQKEYTIVSGLASGCDTIGHTYAVNHSGKTIAVIGTTLDKHFPKENYSLQEKIGKEHLLVSQYPIGINTYSSFFAHRNITTVGLSKDGLVVILSSDKSGTMHAIRECIDSGKQLYILSQNLNRGYEWTVEYQNKYKVVNNER